MTIGLPIPEASPLPIAVHPDRILVLFSFRDSESKKLKKSLTIELKSIILTL